MPSAASAAPPPFEVLIVDNASTDGSVEAVRAYEREQADAQRRTAFAALRVVETGANLGFAAGNNAGARMARGSPLAFLNNDTVVEPDWLARLCAALESHPEFAIATSRLVFLDDPSIVDSAGDGYLRAGGAFKHGYGGPAAPRLVSREVFGACGGAFLIRRPVYEALGGFDERFFMVYEDVDLSYRARLLGHRCWYAAGCSRPARRKWDARCGQSCRRVLRPAQSRVDVVEEHTDVTPGQNRTSSHPLLRGRARTLRSQRPPDSCAERESSLHCWALVRC